MSGYLWEKGTGVGRMVKARLRCGNVGEANKYWRSELERMCEICERNIGTSAGELSRGRKNSRERRKYSKG